MCVWKALINGLFRQREQSAARSLIFPSGISVGPHMIGESRYWRVRLGSRFTGGKRVEMHFPTLDKARKWIFGDAQKQKAAAGSLLELKARAGTAVFELSSAQVNEAINAFKRLEKVNMSLTEAVDCPLFYDFPTDSQCWTMEDAYMFGPDVLVAPILFEGQRARDVYLPSGPRWISQSDRKIFDGGQVVNQSAPLAYLPIFSGRTALSNPL